MLDVDGKVIPAADLIERVERLLESVDAARPPLLGRPLPDAGPLDGIDAHLQAMRTLAGQLEAPQVARGPGPRGSLAWLTKRVIRKASQWYIEPRWRVQQAYDAHAAEFALRSSQDLRRLDNEVEILRRQTTQLRLQLVTCLQRLNQMRALVERASADAAAEVLDQLDLGHRDIDALRQEVSGILERLGAASSEGFKINYAEFEDRFRGPADEVREAQRRYVALFGPSEVPGRILDIGSGRGEMVELLLEAGHDAVGVDMDDSMIEVARSKGLPVLQENGIHALEQTPDGTLKGIFCAQVVEHLLTSELERFVRLAQQKLQPGGVLLMETINPRSLYALSNHFFADTSHVRPVHPETLRFLCEQVGFTQVDVEDRAPHPMSSVPGLPEGPLGQAVEALLANVFGYMDYTVTATK